MKRRVLWTSAEPFGIVLFVLAFCLWILACLWVQGCGSSIPPEESSFRGPIVLITLSDLRADLVASLGGETGWTPELDRFAAEAHFAQAGVTASSSPVPSILSIATGTDPWQHGVLSHSSHQRSADLPTLGEMMSEMGFRTRLWAPLKAKGLARYGPFDGFQESRKISELLASPSLLEEDSVSGPSFTWIHLPYVAFPYKDRRDALPRLQGRPIPEKNVVEKNQLLLFANPKIPLPSPLESSARELYRHEVAWADARVGELLQILREGPDYDKSLIVITALHGTELGERGQTLFGQNLGRESIAVPLLIKLPEGQEPAFPDPEGPVAVTRIWSTLAEMVDRPTAPAHLPSLFRQSSTPILSSLYGHGPLNRFSIIDQHHGETYQAILNIPYSRPEPHFFAAQMVQAGWKKFPVKTPPKRMRRRMEKNFSAVPPLSGSRAVQLTLEQWLDDGSTREITESELRSSFAEELELRWRRFADLERNSNLEHKMRALDQRLLQQSSNP